MTSPDVATLVKDGTAAGQWTLDPTQSSVEFAVKHFWKAITVRGGFTELAGSGTVTPDGQVGGELTMAAASVTTKNKQRDKHLRSADFFDAEAHPSVILRVTSATPESADTLAVAGELEAAGKVEPVSFTARVADAEADAVTLRAELTVDRRRFGMTWSPLRMSAFDSTATVTARFTRTGTG